MTYEENECLSEFWKTVPFTNEALIALFTALTKVTGEMTLKDVLLLLQLLDQQGFKVSPK